MREIEAILPDIYHITMAIINDLISTNGYFIPIFMLPHFLLMYVVSRCMENQFSHITILPNSRVVKILNF